MRKYLVFLIGLVSINFLNITTGCTQDIYHKKIALFARKIVEDIQGKDVTRLTVINLREIYSNQRFILSDILEEDLTNKLIQIESKPFTVVQVRQEEVLNELRKHIDDIYDEQKRGQFGRMAGADAILTGSYRREENKMRLSTRIISIQTGEAIAAPSDLFLPLEAIPEEYLPPSYRDFMKTWQRKKELQKYRLRTLLKSTILPGWGQYDSGYYTKGTLFFLSELALAGGTFYFHSKSIDEKETWKNRDRYRQNYRHLLYGAIAVYGLNLLDALIFAPKDTGKYVQGHSQHEFGFAQLPRKSDGFQITFKMHF